MPAGDTLHSVMKGVVCGGVGWRVGEGKVRGEEGERTAFNIIFGSGLIRFVFPFPFIAICLEGKRPFTVV